MKKAFKVLIKLGVFCFLLGLLVIPTASAVQGSWYSYWGFDMDGRSSVGTTNASTRAWYQLSVKRGNGSLIGWYSVQVGQHESASQTFWGQVFLDRQGVVSVTPSYWHSPWFVP